MKQWITGLLVLASGALQAQPPVLTLAECIRLAKANYPLARQNEYLRQIGENRDQLTRNAWLPQLTAGGQATYQSEASKFEFAGFPAVALPKDNYVIGLQLRQDLLDAGKTKGQQGIDRLNTAVDIQQNETELYNLAARVNQLYGNILLTRKNLEVLNLYQQNITNNRKQITAAVSNGLALQSNLDVLSAESLTTDQHMIEARSDARTYYQSLGLLINRTLSDTTILDTTFFVAKNTGDTLDRPELKLYNLQKQLLDERSRQLQRNTMPTLQVIGEANYGRPGYDFLKQNLRPFGKIGFGVSWNMSSLYNVSKERKNLAINKEIIDSRKETFELNTRTTLTTEDDEISKLGDIIQKDSSIIEARKRVSNTVAIQLANGSVTATDYLTELNKEMEARLNQKVHEVRLLMAISNYNITKGLHNF